MLIDLLRSIRFDSSAASALTDGEPFDAVDILGEANGRMGMFGWILAFRVKFEEPGGIGAGRLAVPPPSDRLLIDKFIWDELSDAKLSAIREKLKF